MTDTVDTCRLAGALRKKWWVILLAGLICGGICLGITVFAVTPGYETEVVFRIVPEEENGDGLNVARDLAKSCTVILQTRQCRQEIAQRSGTGIAWDQLQLFVSIPEETEFVQVRVRADSASNAQRIALAAAKALPQCAENAGLDGEIRVVDPPVQPQKAQWPNHAACALMAALLGILLAAAAVTLAEAKKQNWTVKA